VVLFGIQNRNFGPYLAFRIGTLLPVWDGREARSEVRAALGHAEETERGACVSLGECTLLVLLGIQNRTFIPYLETSVPYWSC
jgi:hypothetical protein